MKVMVIGSDGYIGRELCRKLQDKHDVATVDSLWRRYFMDWSGFVSATPVEDMKPIADRVINIAEHVLTLTYTIMKEDPDVIINLGQIPIPTYSMLRPEYSAEVQINNTIGSLNLYWAVKEVNPEIPIITIGTLGEYGLPDYPLPDGGWVEFEYKGHKDTVPTPRYTLASLYHVSKTQSAYNAYFACKIWGLTIIEIQQGPVFGARPDTWFYFDWVSGTAINRICAQAIVGEVLRYGSGEQTVVLMVNRDRILKYKHTIMPQKVLGWSRR